MLSDNSTKSEKILTKKQREDYKSVMKKYIYVAISVMFILSLQGCGNSSDSAVASYEDTMAEAEMNFIGEVDKNAEETADEVSIKSDFVEDSDETAVMQSEEATGYSEPDESVQEKKKLQKWETYYADGRLVEYGIYSYDDEGNAKEQVYGSGSSNGDSLKWIHTYSYDNEGNVTQEQHFVNEDDSPLWYKIYSYDNQGNLSQEQWFNADGTPSDVNGYYIYNYDNQGRLIKKQGFMPDGTPGGDDIYNYDNQGKLTQIQRYGLDGTLVGYTDYSYDAQGNQIQEEFYNEDRLCWKHVNSYDNEGNMTKQEIYDAFGNLDTYTIYTY